jgi:hypothetical protein
VPLVGIACGILLATPLAPAQRAAPGAAPAGVWFTVKVFNQKTDLTTVSDSRITVMIFNKNGKSQDILVEGFTEGTGVVKLFLAYSQFGTPVPNKKVRVNVTRTQLQGGDSGRSRHDDWDATNTYNEEFVIPVSPP